MLKFISKKELYTSGYTRAYLVDIGISEDVYNTFRYISNVLDLPDIPIRRCYWVNQVISSNFELINKLDRLDLYNKNKQLVPAYETKGTRQFNYCIIEELSDVLCKLESIQKTDKMEMVDSDKKLKYLFNYACTKYDMCELDFIRLCRKLIKLYLSEYYLEVY